jgi:Ca2+-binding RTX toxin-like protein
MRANEIATETIKAYSTSGIITINISTINNLSSTGSDKDHIDIDTNTYSAAGTTGITYIHGSNGAHTIRSSTYNSNITIDTHDSNDSVIASSSGGIIVVNTGGGNDTIVVTSGTGGATINGGSGTNNITLGAHSVVADTIKASEAYATLVTGATLGDGLADIYQFGSVLVATAVGSLGAAVAGTSAASIDTRGILQFTGTVTSSGAAFAAEVLTLLKANGANYGRTTSFDDGVNQWVFMASDVNNGRYIELIDSSDALFAGASSTKAAHTILLGA